MILNPAPCLRGTSWWRTEWPIQFSIFNFPDCNKESLPVRVVQESRREKEVRTELLPSPMSSDQVELTLSGEQVGSKPGSAEPLNRSKDSKEEEEDGEVEGCPRTGRN